jgi:hypothetical protein
LAQRVARRAPPFARRILQAALVGAWALVPSVAAAAPPSAPLTVHVDSRGRLTTDPGRTARTAVPAARAPDTRHATATTTTIGGRVATTRSANTTTTIRPAPPLPRRATPTATTRAPSSSPLPTTSPAPGRERVHVVVPGDNLWRIARGEVARARGTYQPTDAQIAPYWQQLIAENRPTLRSGDPSLIFPGEVVELP